MKIKFSKVADADTAFNALKNKGFEGDTGESDNILIMNIEKDKQDDLLVVLSDRGIEYEVIKE
jgi:hypothetical protein